MNNVSERLPEHVLANAPYGKACLNCVKSKTRCAVLPSGPKCERCLRLNKDCQPAPAIRKRKVARRTKSSTSVASKTAALEEKLDGLTQIIQRSQAAQASSSAPPSHSVTSKSSTQYVSPGIIPEKSLCSQIYAPPTPSASTVSTSNQLPCINRYLQDNASSPAFPNQNENASPSSLPTNSTLEEEAELIENLEKYRTKLTPYFPVVVIDKNVTARELMEERPFLSLVIRAICNKSAARQAELGVEVRRVLGREMLVEGAKNVDLLLGLLLFASWGHYYIYNKPIISTIIQLATSLIFDLGLTKPVPTEPTLIMLTYSAQGCPKPQLAAVGTMEEKRAVIGLFVISSVCSCYFQRIEPLRWVPYFEECLQLLEKSREYPTDLLLVFLTRIQLIKNTMTRDTWNDNVGSGTANPPCELYFKSLQLQLDELKRNMPPELETNITVQLHLHHTDLTLHEHCLGISSAKNAVLDPSKKLQLVKNLWTCLDATKSWFAIFTSEDIFPLSSYAHMPLALMSQMAHFIVALYRLSTFEFPGVSWDRNVVRQELDLGVMIRLLSDKWGGVPAAAGLNTSGTGVTNIWLLTRRMLEKVGNWWDMKVLAPCAVAASAAEADSERGPGDGVATGHGNDAGVDDLHGFGGNGQLSMQDIDFGATNMDLLDEVWMKDLLAGDFQFQLDPFL